MANAKEGNIGSAELTLPGFKCIGRGTDIILAALTESGDLEDVLALISRVDRMSLNASDPEASKDLQACADLLFAQTILLGLHKTISANQAHTRDAAYREFLGAYWGQQKNYGRGYDVQETCKRLGWKLNEAGSGYIYRRNKTIKTSTLMELAMGCDCRLGIKRSPGARRPD